MITLPPLLRAHPTDREALVDLLTSVHLPTEDLPATLDTFLVAKERGKVVGSVGLEVYGSTALLRSLAVTPGAQGMGLGRLLYETAMNLAAGKGIQDVYLITTTAAPFFEKQGFVKVDRAQVPQAIQATKQFAEVCPASATVMSSRIS